MPRRRAFTVLELLVVVSIIAALVGILLPAISKARDKAHITVSQTNLRNLAIGHATYAADWRDRQFTLIRDDMARYGVGIGAFHRYYIENGGQDSADEHPGPILGWGYLRGDPEERYVLHAYRTHETGSGEGSNGQWNASNSALNMPVSFAPGRGHFGSFRLINVQQFNQYVSGRFYDPVFYAPKDAFAIETIERGGFFGANCFDVPGQYCDRPPGDHGEWPVFATYCMSPAAMFHPKVMAHDDPDDASYNGFTNPWRMDSGFRSPAMSQALNPSLKTMMVEQPWLQNPLVGCIDSIVGRTYDRGCEPLFFNHGEQSTPVSLFYDGHVRHTSVQQAMADDERVQIQTGGQRALWSRDTPWGPDGYLIGDGYENANTSYHVLTTNGIRGRDFTSH